MRDERPHLLRVRGQLLAAAVERLHLGQVEGVDVLPDVRELGVTGRQGRGIAALLAADPTVVRDHGDSVLGDLYVELERTHAELQSFGERGKSALHGEAQSAAVRLEVELRLRRGRSGAGGEGLEQNNEEWRR